MQARKIQLLEEGRRWRGVLRPAELRFGVVGCGGRDF